MKKIRYDLGLYLCAIIISITLNQSIAIITFLFAIYSRLEVIIETIANKKE